ncbi:uncharacterized protein [Zea mays]|uniref:Uncharacterized protein n=1 Tax=Zea mays TaxID=4577 RepID=A0A804N9F9_MAIZE|nr:uncharacterized protein LOC103650895 [Zea mays]|eukprot:XP_008674705.1 uncharacterized protein LOC103650895 [Zea mays]
MRGPVLGAVSSLNAGYAYCGLYERDDEYRPVHEVEPTVRLGLRVFAVVNAIMLTIVNIIISESLLGKIVAPAGMIVMVGFVFAITTDDAEPGITQTESMV